MARKKTSKKSKKSGTLTPKALSATSANSKPKPKTSTKLSIPTTSEMKLTRIGIVKALEQEGKFWLEMDEEYRPAMKELEKFSHAIILWWADKCDTDRHRKIRQVSELPPFYGDHVPTMGIFATRSEYRPNPIAVSITPLLHVDQKNGIITLPWFEAYDGTPVVDIKPYLLMTDKVDSAEYPPYLQHWPRSMEDAVQWWASQMTSSEMEQ